MRLVLVLVLFLASFLTGSAMEKPSSHTQGTPTGRPSGPINPGEYWWAPVVSPTGPVMVLVSIPNQVMHVYRNGILVGRSSVSTGAKGHSTPSGVFTILQKKKSHYSSSYANAPMPHMQRLTWTGICMHSGNLPGYPASHGCIRMPYDFSKLLFNLTAQGGTVVIGGTKATEPHFASNPGVLLAPKDFTNDMIKPLPAGGYDWRPERSADGPVTILVSSADKAIYVYRNGTPIGTAAIEIVGSDPLGGHVFSMLEGSSEKWSILAPFRKARKWLAVASASDNPKKTDFDELAARVVVPPEFAAKVYDQLSPGATIVVTDEAAVRKASKDFSILTN
ncbi:MAG: L,D-transpeptidase [Verrucomicrobiaceae bacterium]|nr:L,D-transpeptidase [Verrucomicrobiaceae bacterium]